MTGTLHRNAVNKLDELRDVPGFAETFLADEAAKPAMDVESVYVFGSADLLVIYELGDTP